MSIGCHVVVSCVHDRLTANLDMKHCSSQDMTSIVCFDLQFIVNLDSFVKIDSNDLLHAVLDHLRREKV